LKVSATWLYINCDLKHVDKSRGIDRLIARAGLDPERIAGIGDTAGDELIRRKVAWFACPANAVAEMKARAQFVSSRPEAQGVVQILERLDKE